MNSTVLHLLSESLDLDEHGGRWTNGLERFAGTWTEEEFEEFERNTAVFSVIDEELWK